MMCTYICFTVLPGDFFFLILGVCIIIFQSIWHLVRLYLHFDLLRPVELCGGALPLFDVFNLNMTDGYCSPQHIDKPFVYLFFWL